MVKTIESPLSVLIMIVVYAFLSGGLSGCKSLSPEESTQAGFNETRTLIKEHVSDISKVTKLITMVDQLEIDLKAYEKKHNAHNEGLIKKNADYNTSRNDLQKLYNAFNSDFRLMAKKIVNTHLEMKRLTTQEEWAAISKKKHRIGGF